MKLVIKSWDTKREIINLECYQCWCIFKTNEYHIDRASNAAIDFCPECWNDDCNKVEE